LFLIASKTFTTIETMTNAHSAKAWFVAQGGTDVARHFAALTTNVAAAKCLWHHHHLWFLGLGGRAVFGLVGHWSAAGDCHWCPGLQGFLAGAHAMDEHFRSAELARNLPVRLGLLDIWYRNFHGFGSRSVAPYHSALKRYPAYLQQLEMESNGKGVDLTVPLHYRSPARRWSGVNPAPTASMPTFKCCIRAPMWCPWSLWQSRTPARPAVVTTHCCLANVLAQAQALMLGKCRCRWA
jgi:glucose-6-phosphate isomerase